MIIEIYGEQYTTLYRHILAALDFVKPYTLSFVIKTMYCHALLYPSVAQGWAAP